MCTYNRVFNKHALLTRHDVKSSKYTCPSFWDVPYNKPFFNIWGGGCTVYNLDIINLCNGYVMYVHTSLVMFLCNKNIFLACIFGLIYNNVYYITCNFSETINNDKLFFSC